MPACGPFVALGLPFLRTAWFNANDGPPEREVSGIDTWTGAEARLLRTVALRLSVREFAQLLGIPPRTISKWEQAGATRQPRPHMQAMLDTALERADVNARARFVAAAAERGGVRPASLTLPQANGSFDYEAWADDIDRARLHADRQDFQFADRLMTRWLGKSEHLTLDERSLYLKGKSLVVLGNVQRDQGMLSGSYSAQATYRQALGIYGALSLSRRHAQVELLLTVLTEMLLQHDASAARYRALADDERLGALDRARARLWVGTALAKAASLTTGQSSRSPRSGRLSASLKTSTSRTSGACRTRSWRSRTWPLAIRVEPPRRLPLPSTIGEPTRRCSKCASTLRTPTSCALIRRLGKAA